MLIVKRVSVKFFQEIKSDMRPVLHQGVVDDFQVAVQADNFDFVPHLFQCCNNVILGLPRRDLFIRETLGRMGRHEVLMHENERPEWLICFIGHRAMRWYPECTTFIVCTVKAIRTFLLAWALLPATFSLSLRDLSIISCSR